MEDASGTDHVRCGEGDGLVAATTCFRQADIISSTIFYKRRIEGISYFPHTVALSARDKVSPPHLTRETLSGRRPADGADTPGGVSRPGENLPGEGDTADIFRRRRRE